MQRFFKKVLVFLCVAGLVLMPFSLSAHSGRTDAYGGHRDNRNVSGLGYYHYHHGYGPHLHPNGVCPYETTSSTSTSTTIYFAKPDVTYHVTVDGEEIDCAVDPFMSNERLLVPMRAIFEALDAEVHWNANTKTVTATKGSTDISLPVGGKVATVNGKWSIMDVNTQLKDGVTMVPLRFVSEALGADVYYDADIYTAVITTT